MNKIMHTIEPEELMAYLDGELTADRAADTASHMKECAGCQEIVAGLQSVSRELKAWKVEDSQTSIPPVITTALADNSEKSQKTFFVLRQTTWLGRHKTFLAWAGGAAAILLVSFGTVSLGGRNENNVFSSVGLDLNASDRRESKVLSAPMSVSKPTHDKQSAELQTYLVPQHDQSAAERGVTANAPMIIRTADLTLITKEFDKTRTNLEAILKRHRGYIGELKVGGSTGSGRTLIATLRVPADQLDVTLAEVKSLGRVESENQGGQDVTSQYVDLQARLANARNTEQRLTDLLRNRTGKLSDVLEVEQELDRVRGEIEQMEAERKTMANQVSFATLNATITEDYQAQLQVVPPSTSTRLGNAAVEGYRSMVDGVVSLALFLLSNGPSLLLWGAVLFFPARMLWKKLRRSFAP
ncbi:MAG TPA: DUF4349 domain-containing protein [Terriglobales bacterium]|nr:DUF4349 domain-containing protein [Terriglobales bacterium]